MNEKAVSINYEDVKIGSMYSFERKISRKDIMDFARLTEDFNPLHIDKKFGAKSKFKNNIVHGMFTGSLFSKLIGMHCPPENNVYLSQTLNFKNPVFPGDVVLVKGTVMNKNDSIRVITMKTEIFVRGRVAVSGEAKVGMLKND